MRFPFVNCRCVLPRPEEGEAYRRAIRDLGATLASEQTFTAALRPSREAGDALFAELERQLPATSSYRAMSAAERERFELALAADLESGRRIRSRGTVLFRRDPPRREDVERELPEHRASDTADAVAYAFRTPSRQADLEQSAAASARRAGETLESRHFFGEARALGRDPLEEQERERRSRRFEAVRLETSDPSRARIPGILDVRRGTVRVAVHLYCRETTNPERPPLVIRCDQDRTRRCSACSYVWNEVELMISPELAAIGIGVADVPEIEYAVAIGEVDRRLSSSGFYGEEPAIPDEAEPLAPPSSSLPKYRPR